MPQLQNHQKKTHLHDHFGIINNNGGVNGLRVRKNKSTIQENVSQSDVKRSSRTLPDKIFVERESLLTQMFQVQEFRGLYNIFLVIFVNTFVYAVLSDYARHGEISLGWSNLITSFGKPWLMLCITGGLHLVAILTYAPFELWRRHRKNLIGGDVIFSIYILGLVLMHMYGPIRIQRDYHLPIASAAIVAIEQVRILMKMYAFHRINIPRVIEKKFGGSFSKYIYFLYAPTLIYQDIYPRTKEIRWDFVIRNVVELLGCICFYNLLHSLCGWVLLERFGLETISIPHLIDALFFQMIPGGVGFLLGFFILLHTSQNISGEILRFGDREFYKDWWNSESFAAFYRNWNLPVHGFLYTYIYKEAVEFGFRSKYMPALSVFFVSAVVHEYILAFVLGFFFPVLLILFGVFGVVLSFCKSPRIGGNLFVWWSLITGKGIILFFYSIEHFARLNNCPPAQNPFWDFVTPRSMSCFVKLLPLY